MRRFALILALLAPAAFAEAPSEAMPTHAAEAVITFKKFCVDSGGNAAKAQELLHEFTEEETAQKVDSKKSIVLTGHASKEVWLLRGPRTLQPLLLDYEADHTCNLWVNDADMKEIRAEFAEFVKTEGGTVEAKDGGEVAEDRAMIGGAEVKLTARAKPENDTQHILRFEVKGK